MQSPFKFKSYEFKRESSTFFKKLSELKYLENILR